MQFEVKTIYNKNIKEQLHKIGFDPSYIDYAAKKHTFLTIKIKNVPCHTATIIKETALSNGADAGISKGVLLREIETTDIILSGSIKQLDNIANNLSMQPFGLKEVALQIKEQIKLNLKNSNKKLMGILNLTEDSSSDGGKYLETDKAIEHAQKLIKDGADIIDIGAEATNINSTPIDFELEIKRLTPVVKELINSKTTISIDTRNSKTAEAMLKLGVDIINDISMLNHDKRMLDIIKESSCSYVLTHSRGTPQDMDNFAKYQDTTEEIYTELLKKLEYLEENNIKNDRIIVDVGFGFAKNTEQNFEILKKIKEFNSLGLKTIAGLSRKRFIKSLTSDNSIEESDILTSISTFYLLESDIDIIRVHNVKQSALALKLYNSIY